MGEIKSQDILPRVRISVTKYVADYSNVFKYKGRGGWGLLSDKFFNDDCMKWHMKHIPEHFAVTRSVLIQLILGTFVSAGKHAEYHCVKVAGASRGEGTLHIIFFYMRLDKVAVEAYPRKFCSDEICSQ
jgi:hypothetical protein